MDTQRAPVLFGEDGSRRGGDWTWCGEGWSAVVARHSNTLAETHWRAVFFVGDDEQVESDFRDTAQAAATELEGALRTFRGALANAFS